MITEKQMLNKIKWDRIHYPITDNITFTYIDFNKEKELPFDEIQNIEGRFMQIFVDEQGLTDIPLHRIRKIKENQKVIWSRK